MWNYFIRISPYSDVYWGRERINHVKHTAPGVCEDMLSGNVFNLGPLKLIIVASGMLLHVENKLKNPLLSKTLVYM